MSDFLSISIVPNSGEEEVKEIIVALISEYPFNYFNTEGAEIVAHAKTEDFTDDQKTEVEEIIAPFCSNYTWEYQEKQNWNELWEKNFFEPLQIQNVHIRATFHPEVNEGIVITIQPRMSFGTGHHSTTRLMIQEMLKLESTIKNSTVLDMGAGTGILGIVAEKLGAKEIIGIEIDDWVVDNANDNLKVNECNRTIMIQGTADSLNHYSDLFFDIILANIHREIILADLDAYLRVLNKHGIILISGLQITDLDMVNEVCISKNLTPVNRDTHGDWGVLIYCKN